MRFRTFDREKTHGKKNCVRQNIFVAENSLRTASSGIPAFRQILICEIIDGMSELDQYDYELPEDLVAQHPLARRSDARMMVVRRASQTITHAHVRDLGEFLRAGDALVLNDSRVLPARLVGYRTATGGKWEGLFLGSDPQSLWRILGRTRGRLHVGETITLTDRAAYDAVTVQLVARLSEGQWAARVDPALPAVEILDRVGRIPLPHYIRGGLMVASDMQDYQTVFATHPGSVAAPTAGLHFTQALLNDLQQMGVAIMRITLHVGLGTFRPVTSQTLDEHVMHSEWCSVSEDVAARINQVRQQGGRLIAVGTTTVRSLETAAASGQLRAWSGETRLFIRPPYKFVAIDGMLTNFHLPKSTLLVLVRTFGGDALIRRAYESAINEQYRFFSYGDAMLIL